MIIIPDVHGRTFWKDSIPYVDEGIIFLGDYLDPYPWEHISPEEAIDNFKEIIEFKKANPDKVTLLLGNHDFMTYLSRSMGNCRTDFKNEAIINNLLITNLDLFKIAEIIKTDTKTFTFSHAPILKGWVNDNMVDGIRYKAFFSKDNDKTIDDIIYKLNWSLKHNFEALCVVLNNVSFRRGGWSDFGSIVWADSGEILDEEFEYDNVYQIFGHTQQVEQPIITEYFANLDCRKAFKLDLETGNIKEL